MKLLNSISFYILASLATVFILNDELNRFTFIGLFIAVVLYVALRHSTEEEIYELLGINWLQKKFKNNPIIMDLKNE